MRKNYKSFGLKMLISGLIMLCLADSALAQYFPVRAVNDQQVVIVPGSAKGNVVTNDQIYNNGPFTLSQLSSPPNGSLTFNTTTGAYTYIPSGTFQGADSWTYQICDGGTDGNLATTADNNCSVARVTFRNIFNCKNTVFYIPIPENEARDFLEDINTGNNDSTRVYVGLSVLGEGYIIYDHWEDGFEADITNPVQPTSKIWGDGDLSNGVAPGYPTDVIPAGSTLILTNNLSSGHNNTPTYNPNAVGADATLQATIDYDGKDKIYASGEASMSKFAWGTVGTVSTSSSSVPPTRDWGTAFRLPVGQNTASTGAMFEITSLSIIAKDDNTVVTIDRDANGSNDINVTLNEGETYYVDSRQGATIIAVNQGATVNATKPVQVMLMTGDFNSGYAGRTFALTPTATLSSAYYMPAVPQETVRVYLYNPTAAAITVIRTTAGGATVNINVPANGSNFNDVNSSGLGYRFSSTVPFGIISTVDYNSVVSDWGFTPVPATNMSPVSLFSFAEGSDPTNVLYGANNYSKILITPDCNTYVYVDVNGDGVADKVSFNDDIDVLDVAVAIGGVNYNETTSNNGILVNQYQTLTIGGPSGTLNGTRVWTTNAPNNTGGRGCNLAVVYGQDGGPNGAPNIDAGYTLPTTSIPLEVNTTIPSSVCPGNTTSFIQPTVVDLNGVAPFNVLLVNKTTNEVIQLTTNSASINLNATNPGNYILKINDDNCLTFELSFTINSNPNCSTNALNDENSTWQDVNVSGNVITNDFDLEGNTQTFGTFLNQSTLAPITTGTTVSGVDQSGAPVANAGTLSFDASGNYTFDPSPAFLGTVSVPYQVCDNGVPVFCDTAVLTITVSPFPASSNSVIANNDENISYGSPVANNVLTNDRDPQGDTFTVTAVTGSTPGTTFTVPGTGVNGSNVADAGTLVINTDGSYIYTPAVGFIGSINVPYTITDALGATATAVLHIYVLFDRNDAANDPPFAGDDFSYTTIDVPVNGIFINNDSDPNSNQVSYNGTTILASGPATAIGVPVVTAQGGTIQFYANGTYLYTPPAGYTGPDQVVYTICDVTVVAPQPLCADATLQILIGPANTTNAVNDENSTWEDVDVSGIVLTNDFDLEGNTQTFGTFLNQATLAPITTGATVSGVDQAGAPVANAGTLSFDANGGYTFDPEPGFTGTVSVPYQVCDNGTPTACDTAILTITVTPLPSASNSVIANNDENISYGSPVSGNILSNDRDPQGDAFTVTAVTGGTPGTGFTVPGKDNNGNAVVNAGTLVINSDGTYTYTPAPGFTGSIDVPYTITDALGATATAVLHIDVLLDNNGPANNPPFAGDDFGYTTVNVPVTGSFINNDNDPNGDSLSYNGTTIDPSGPATAIGVPVVTAQGGTIQFYANGTYLYTPPAGYTGPDQVVYTICDVTVVAPQPLCADATIQILIGPANTTNAVNDENSTWEDVNVSGIVLTNDFDLEGNTQTFGTFLNQATLAPITTGATVSGVDQAGAPVANAGTLSFDANGGYTFDPEPGFTGTVSVPYQVCDNGTPTACDTAILTITVTPLPSASNSVIANNDENISYGSPVSGNILSNDRDPQGDAFTVTAVTGGTPGTGFTVPGKDNNGNAVVNAGTLVINSDGTYTYTPAPGFTGSIDVPYTITDALGATATAVLHIDVLLDNNGPANNPPFAGDDFGYTTVNVPVTGSFINNDNDPNGDSLSYNGTTIDPSGPATAIGSPVATAQGGTVQFYANGTYLYTPPAGYTGPDQVNYTICDVTVVTPQPLCADATIHFLVGPGITISGKVWNDANGNIVDDGAGEPETNISNQLFVNLVNASGDVVATTLVAVDGTYSFANITPGTSYSLQLSSVQGTVGQPASVVTLPLGWVNTGENRDGTIDGGVIGIIDTRNYGFTNIVNLDFGIEQLPETDSYSTNISQPIVGQFITLNGGANPPVLSGTDPEDCNTGCVLTVRSLIIETVPVNAELYYNGVLVTAGQQIDNFDPSLLQVQITAATLGAVSTSFTYSFVDAAGEKDPTPATYTLTWLSPVPVTGLTIQANVNGTNAMVMWQTQTEINTSYFVLERSLDNRNFTSVGNPVTAAGNSNSPRSYQLNENISRLMNAPVIYYRIRVTDIDGRVRYSNVAAVRLNMIAGITVWPNPFSSSIVLSVKSTEPSRIKVTITDVAGKTVASSNFNVNTGLSQVTINNLEGLAKGIYMLNLINEKSGVQTAQKLLKE